MSKPIYVERGWALLARRGGKQRCRMTIAEIREQARLTKREKLRIGFSVHNYEYYEKPWIVIALGNG